MNMEEQISLNDLFLWTRLTIKTIWSPNNVFLALVLHVWIRTSSIIFYNYNTTCHKNSIPLSSFPKHCLLVSTKNSRETDWLTKFLLIMIYVILNPSYHFVIILGLHYLKLNKMKITQINIFKFVINFRILEKLYSKIN